MLDVRAASIIYQSQVALAAIVDDLVTSKRLGKAKDLTWQKCLLIRRHLKALEYVDRLDDQSQATYILECLIKLTGINDFPVAPTLTVDTVPNILVGVKGDTGDKGDIGATGPTGLATDIQVGNVITTSLIDSFAVATAPSSRWDYTITETLSNAQRAGTVIGTWSADGAAVEYTDSATPDILGSTGGLEFSIQFNAGNIQLFANITTGTWFVRLSRYFIPNNGNGSGPVGSVLLDGKIYVGNAANVATGVALSGAATISNTGVLTLSPGIVVDSNISNSAAITLTKLATVTPNRAVVSDGSGYLTASSVTDVQLSYLSGATSNIQAQINAISIPSLTANRPVVSDGAGLISSNGALATNALTKWTGTQFANSLISDDGAIVTISGTTNIAAGNVIRINGSNQILTKIINIGDWNMDSTLSVSVAHSLGDYTKIRGAFVSIIPDVGGAFVANLSSINAATGACDGAILNYTSTNIVLQRTTGGTFDSNSYDATSFNRGFITLIYEA